MSNALAYYKSELITPFNSFTVHATRLILSVFSKVFRDILVTWSAFGLLFGNNQINKQKQMFSKICSICSENILLPFTAPRHFA